MNRKTIKNACVFLILISIVCLIVLPSKPAIANYSFEKNHYFTTGALLWKTEWKANASKHSSMSRLFFRNLSGTTYWGQKATKAEIKITSTKTVSSTKTHTKSAELGLKVPVKAVEVSGKIGGSSSNAVTYTASNSASHARTLDRSSPKGYYSLQSTMNASKYKVKMYKKDGSSYKYDSTGYMYSYRATSPYVYLRHTSAQH